MKRNQKGKKPKNKNKNKKIQRTATMAYQQHEKSPGGSTQSPVGTYEEGIEAVTYQHGQYPEHYIPGQESPQVYHGQHAYPMVAADAKGNLPTSAPGTNAKGSTMFGMQRRVFWILVGLLVLLLVLVIGLGAGLGAKVAQADSRYEKSCSFERDIYIYIYSPWRESCGT